MQRSISLRPRPLVPGGAFSELGAASRADFESVSMDFALPCGVVLFYENTPGTQVLLIHSGRVKLSCTSRDDRTLLLKVAVPGDILGLSAVVSRSLYEVTAITVAPTILRRVRGGPFRSFLATHVEASLLAAQTLSEAYRVAFADVRRLALSGSSAARLAGVLLEWATAESVGKPEMRLTMALSHEDLGNLVGCSRETVTRTLGEFRRQKLIAIHGVSILIPFPEKLGRIAA
jgi:CRP/FNR family transcriptional regulator, cyclic AMP receptor protein